MDHSRRSRQPPLAYVFWHWRQSHVDARVYVERQQAFHDALRDAPPPGYQRSLTLAVAGAPWAAEGCIAYEDWYLLDDFTALGALKEAAVSGPRSAPHDAAAALAAGGTAGLYTLRAGQVCSEPTQAYWFGKPAGMTYSDWLAELVPIVERAEGALWMRQLTLGPTLEFCLHARSPVALPSAIEPLSMRLQPASEARTHC